MSKLPWFRFYAEVLHDPKVQRLSPHLFKSWVNLLCLASEAGGELPTTDDIGFHLRLSAHDAQQHVDELIGVGLIDIQPNGRLCIHNWGERQKQSDSSAERVRKHREKRRETQCNDEPETGCNVTVTPQIESKREIREDREESTVRTEYDAAREDATVGRTPAYADLKKSFNGTTETMLAFVERSMGGDCRGNAEQWLASTSSAHGATAVAQAYAIIVEKQAAGEVIARPLPHWSRLAGSLARPAARPQAPAKRGIMDILREREEARAAAGASA